MRRSAPRRTCVGCRRTASAAELVRLRWTPLGLEVGRGPGRGAWLCGNHPVACLDQVAKRPALARALRAPVSSGDVAGLRATLDTEISSPEE